MRAIALRHGVLSAVVLFVLFLLVSGITRGGESALLLLVLLVPLFAVLGVLFGVLVLSALVPARAAMAATPGGLVSRRLWGWKIVAWEELEAITREWIAHRAGPFGIFEHVTLVRRHEVMHLVYPADDPPRGTPVRYTHLPRPGLYLSRRDALRILARVAEATGLEVTPVTPGPRDVGSVSAPGEPSSTPPRPPA